MSAVNISAKAIFLDALDCTAPHDLKRFLDEACGSDVALRARVEELLQAHRQAGNFLCGTRNISDNESALPRLGTLVGPYKLMEAIGEGGMGLVYVAEQQQ